jgi:hypothetical protein
MFSVIVIQFLQSIFNEIIIFLRGKFFLCTVLPPLLAVALAGTNTAWVAAQTVHMGKVTPLYASLGIGGSK